MKIKNFKRFGICILLILLLTIPLVLASAVVHEGVHVYQVWREPITEFTHFSISKWAIKTHYKEIEEGITDTRLWEFEAYTVQALFLILMLLLLRRELK